MRSVIPVRVPDTGIKKAADLGSATLLTEDQLKFLTRFYSMWTRVFSLKNFWRCLNKIYT